MDMFYIPAIASFSGSASGTLASIVTGWVTQRRKDRIRHTLRATSQREELYKNFIEEASRLYADAIVNDKSEVSKLVDLYALIARMKILSSDAVIEAAEKAGRLILETYLSPNKTFVDLLRGPYRTFAGIADFPGVSLVHDEARAYLTRTPERLLRQSPPVVRCARMGWPLTRLIVS